MRDLHLNHLCYADDLTLISIRSADMQRLLQLCVKYVDKHDLIFNGKKLQCMVLKPHEI